MRAAPIVLGRGWTATSAPGTTASLNGRKHAYVIIQEYRHKEAEVGQEFLWSFHKSTDCTKEASSFGRQKGQGLPEIRLFGMRPWPESLRGWGVPRTLPRSHAHWAQCLQVPQPAGPISSCPLSVYLPRENQERVRLAKDDETQEGCLDGSAILDTTKNYNMVSVYLPWCLSYISNAGTGNICQDLG